MPPIEWRVNLGITLSSSFCRTLTALAMVTWSTSACGPNDPTKAGSLLSKDSLTDAGSTLDTQLKEVFTERSVTDYLNQFRSDAGQVPLTVDPLLTLAAQNHANYLLAHPKALEPGQDPHVEDTESPLFTGLKVQQRIEYVGYSGKSLGENIASRPTSEAALQSWLETLYSRLPLMDPLLEDIGIGQAGSLYERIFVLVAGTRFKSPRDTLRFRVYPDPDATNIAASWSGNELPQPKAPPLGYPSGPVLTLHAPDIPFDGVDGILRDPDGKKIPCSKLTRETDPKLPVGVAALIPHGPLESEGHYSISWVGSANGTQFSIDSSFHTRRVGCDPSEQDCGYGRACYIQQGKSSCLWVGPFGEGDDCLYMNDCSRGLGCYGIGDSQVCRRYCPIVAKVNCDEVCSGPYSTLDDQANTGFCWNENKE
jgi:uncharacterized protein YkwD